MNTTTETISVKEKLLAEFEINRQQLFGADNETIQSIRKKAADYFSKNGIPNRKNEAYKYSNMEAALKPDFSDGTPVSLKDSDIKALAIEPGAIRVVLINGIFSEAHSQLKPEKGFYINSLSKAYLERKDLFEQHFAKYASVESDSFIALNTFSAKDGIFIHLSENLRLEKPVYILNVISPQQKSLVQTRNLFVLEKGAEAKIVQTFESAGLNGKTFSNSLTEIFVDENANIDTYIVQHEGEEAIQVNTVQAYQKANSIFNITTITLSGSKVRNNLNIVLDDKNCEANLNGLYLLNKNQHVDNQTLVDHRKPHCNSNELYKGIMDDTSTGVFNGKIYVRQDAQKTNAFQSNKNVLLSDTATINTKPQLEIYADDVKCSHGTSTGRLDEEAMFYLRSRGIGEEKAKKILVYAFAEEVINAIHVAALKTYVEEELAKRLD